jgi:3-oxoacyl-[acyl-carrier protein] reductase
MHFDLQDKVALVTGGSRGIGAAIALGLAREGCHLAFNHMGDGAAAEGLAQQIRELGRRVWVVESDVSRADQVDELFTHVELELGPLDVVICNAGITRDRVVWKLSDEAWDQVLDVNLKGAFLCNRAAAVRFRARAKAGDPGGRIINIASINGLRGKFGQANYSASKGGIIAMTKTVARELGSSGVTVNAVAPGMVLTAMAEELPEAILDSARSETVLGRLAAPADVADVVVFLASERARHITGQCIQVDGGQLM